MLLWCSSCLGVLFKWRQREPPFIGGEKGVLWKMLPPLMEGTKPTSNWPEDALNLAKHLHNRLCNIGRRWPMKIGPERSQLGCGHTSGAIALPLSTLGPIFVWWVSGWSWIKPKWVLHPNSSFRLGLLLYSLAQISFTPCWNAPFGIFSHVFMFMSCKMIISKYMWN
jgi:hypothetical protein